VAEGVKSNIVWVVMGGGIVVCAYHGPKMYINARRHARCVTGTDAIPLDLSQLSETMRTLVYAELRTELPDDIKRDLELAEWENDEDITPVEVVDFDDQ
jgi:hypothetical protein